MDFRIFLLLVGLVLTACSDKSAKPCTLIGCPPAFQVAVCGALPDPFSIQVWEVTANDQIVGVRDLGPFPGQSDSDCVTASWEEFFPEEVIVAILVSIDTVTIRSTIDYETTLPNGPGCGECTSGKLSVEL